MKILCVCFLFGLGTAGGQSRGCVIYKAGETIPAIPKGARYDTCVDGGKVYQKGASWKCGCNSCSCRPPVMSRR
ncbi:Hypothetical predicted protein [Mytilus galloprovincialis]|uniref:Uncharacterized protein n=1 Tax=Mytilus galloprovincialis TaxID=29158 RepID=A0A8B6E2B1_MYTGA|nr:Hypothetical predicted protein [Mytilus galloprovincialis]